MNQEPKRNVHFIGIGGTGMAPLAHGMLQRGFNVSGSDHQENANVKELRARGAKIFIGHAAEHCPKDATIILSSAIKPGNPELAEAKTNGQPVWHRSDLLCWLMKGKKAITIAGTSGKTTVTALVGHMLMEAGLKPSIFVGGRLHGVDPVSLLGEGEYVVAEADESDGSFLKYRPFISVLTNIDNDHLDHYGSLEEIQEAFGKYLENTDPEGTIIVGWDNKQSQIVGSKSSKHKIAYGFRLGADARALSYAHAHGGLTYTAILDKDLVEGTLPLLGKHNVENALCALAVAKALGLDLRKAAASLSHFPGVERRLHLVYSDASRQIYDDYAHNPAKLSACVRAMREAFPEKILNVIFQPHRYSRVDTMYNEMVTAFKGADKVWLLPVYAAGEEKLKDFSLHKMANDLGERCELSCSVAESFSWLVDELESQHTQGSVFLTVGAGDVWKVGQALGDRFNGKAKKDRGDPQ